MVGRAHVAHVDQAFDTVRELHVDSMIADRRDDPVVYLPDLVLHVVDDLDIADHILDILGLALRCRCVFCNFWEEFFESGELFLVQVLMKPRLDDAMDLEVRISSDRRGEVRVVLEREAIVTEHLLGIDRLGHTLENLLGEHEIIVLLMERIHDLAKRTWREGLS